MACAPSEDSDQSGHTPVWSVFAVRIKNGLVLTYTLSAQRRLWSDWADAQVDLSLCWAHIHFVEFVMRLLNYFQNLSGKCLNMVITSVRLTNRYLCGYPEYFWYLRDYFIAPLVDFSLRKLYSNILKILQSKMKGFQIKFLIFFIFLLKT